MNGHHVTDSQGRLHIRNSASRIYTHAVVISLPGSEIAHAEWSGSKELAEKNASAWRNRTSFKTKDHYRAEVIEAVHVDGRVRDVRREGRAAK